MVPLKRAIDLLQHHCLLGQLHFRQWRRLQESFRNAPAVGNLAPTFFLTTADAHLNSALLILNRLIDKRRDSISIRRFLDRARGAAASFAKSTPQLVREAIDADLQTLEEAESTLNRIRDHRNDQFIHLSQQLLEPPFGVVATGDSFTYEEVYELLTSFGEILNRYSSFLDGSTMHMEVWGEQDDFNYLMRKLEELLRDQTSDDQDGAA